MLFIHKELRTQPYRKRLKEGKQTRLFWRRNSGTFSMHPALLKFCFYLASNWHRSLRRCISLFKNWRSGQVYFLDHSKVVMHHRKAGTSFFFLRKCTTTQNLDFSLFLSYISFFYNLKYIHLKTYQCFLPLYLGHQYNYNSNGMSGTNIRYYTIFKFRERISSWRRMPIVIPNRSSFSSKSGFSSILILTRNIINFSDGNVPPM